MKAVKTAYEYQKEESYNGVAFFFFFCDEIISTMKKPDYLAGK